MPIFHLLVIGINKRCFASKVNSVCKNLLKRNACFFWFCQLAQCQFLLYNLFSILNFYAKMENLHCNRINFLVYLVKEM